MTILGIETSCDETGVAIVSSLPDSQALLVKSNTLATSLALHAQTGGVIPEIAAREQVKFILPTLKKALFDGIGYVFEPHTVPDIDAIAVTYGPGLIGSLLVGVETARTLSYLWNKPLIPVNHLYGHIYANWLTNSSQQTTNNNQLTTNDQRPMTIDLPAIALVVSGGHTDLVLMKNHQDIQVVGGTRDDAAGEAFDKIGRLLGLPYPAGPVIAQLAEKGNPKAFQLPRPMHDSGDFDFSFSGLKTAVFNLIKKNNWDFSSPSTSTNVEGKLESRSFNNVTIQQFNNDLLPNLCASVEQAVVDILVQKTIAAAKKYHSKTILLGGGVAANQKLKNHLKLEIENLKLEIPLSVQPPNLCTDNGAMIAAAAYFHNTPLPWQDLTANPELYFD